MMDLMSLCRNPGDPGEPQEEGNTACRQCVPPGRHEAV